MAEAMMERIARAIYKTWAEIEVAETTFDEMVKLQKLDGYPNAKKFHRMAFAEARAAVEAMREPTKAMVEAAENWHPEDGCEDYTRPVYRVMIDALLTEGGRTPRAEG